MNRKVKLALVGVGATGVAAVGAVVAAGLSYAAAPGDSTRWSTRFFEKTRVGKGLNRLVNKLISAWVEREDISRQTERLAEVHDKV